MRRSGPVTKREVLEEMVARKYAELAEQAPTSLAAHSALLHRTDAGDPLLAARHHREWIRVLENPKQFKAVAIIAPPGYAKSTWISQAYPAWRIGATGGNIRIGLISSTATQARGFSKAIQDVIESDRWPLAYPGVKPAYRRGWRLNEFYVTGTPQGPNPTMLAVGVEGPVLGKRFDEIVLDDPTTWEDARSETTMASQRQWLRNTLVKRFPAGTGPPEWRGNIRMVAVLTRWSVKDLVPDLIDLGFKVVHMPALGYWDRQIICPECEQPREEFMPGACPNCGSDRPVKVVLGNEPLWPEVEDRYQLEREREDDSIIFELVKQGDPQVLAGDVFDTAKINRGQRPRLDEFDRIISFVDTAGGRDRRKGDYFAMATLGRKGHDVWVIYVRRERATAPEQEKIVQTEYERWKPELVCVEMKNEGIALFQQLARKTRVPLKEVDVTADKEWRAIPLSNAYTAGYVWHPEGEPWVRPYEAELEAFPEGDHDDMVDAAAGAYAELDEEGPRVRVLRAR